MCTHYFREKKLREVLKLQQPSRGVDTSSEHHVLALLLLFWKVHLSGIRAASNLKLTSSQKDEWVGVFFHFSCYVFKVRGGEETQWWVECHSLPIINTTFHLPLPLAQWATDSEQESLSKGEEWKPLHWADGHAKCKPSLLPTFQALSTQVFLFEAPNPLHTVL